MKHKFYQFILILKNVDETTLNLEDSLYEAGCDDALVNYRNGTVYLDFDRKAFSFEDAVLSAIKNVEEASVGAIVASIAPEDLITEAEIAKRLNFKRQTISLWTKGERRKNHPFPKPVMKLSDRSPLWKWREVVEWLFQNELIHDYELVERAFFLEHLPTVLEERDVNIKKHRQNLSKRIDAIKHN